MRRKQQVLFDSDPQPWELDDSQAGLVADIVFPSGASGAFSYRVPDGLAGKVEAGRRVRVPLGRANRPVIGYCVGVEHRPLGSRPLKSLTAVIDERTLLSPAMLRLSRWMAEHYLCEWGQVLEAILPAGVRWKAGTRTATLLAISDEGRAALADGCLPTKQREVLRCLAAAAEPLAPAEVASLARCTLAPINALRKGKLIKTVHRRMRTIVPQVNRVDAGERPRLNADQQRALETILAAVRSQSGQVILLHGVTGSGKTEVYMRAIEEVVGYGRAAIVLVPEISLTPQTVERFRSRFPSVAVLHSHQTDAERHWFWEQIAAGRVQVVVGPRSAIFAPVPHLGLIVLDEEHETSFKQETTPRYHARDVALRRAADQAVPLVLGSATPSIESWHRARDGSYQLVELPRRVFNRPLPRVRTIDMLQAQAGRPRRSAISPPLERAMRQALEQDGQVILLLNRRGFATHIQCSSCGAVVRCPRCDIALIHHRREAIALCHYCDYQVAPPAECPQCHFAGILYSGIGTERLEAEVQSRFPEYACLRMDTDAMKGPGAHERALARFRDGEARILLGTQMIAKGLDFPNVTLVGVVNADIALHLPDFRASERTFQLLAQVAGRTGRGAKGGEVYVQTLNPHHPAVEAASRHNYHGFAAVELESRKQFGYPPFGDLLRLVIRGPGQEQAHSFAEHLAEELRTELEKTAARWRLLGPALAPIAKLRGDFRYHILLQGDEGGLLRQAVRDVSRRTEPPQSIHWLADVDPISML
jgi:primosomal protein N' (replication factor Y)